MEKKRVIVGLIFVVVGMLFMGETLGWYSIEASDFPRFIIPLGVIILGIWFIMRKRHQEQIPPPPGQTSYTARPTPAPPPPPDAPPPPEAFSSPHVSIKAETDAGHRAEFHIGTEGFKFNTKGRASQSPSASMPGQLKYSKFAGDMFISFEGITIRNVEVSSAMGDVEINLRGAVLSPGLNRLIISNFLGDIRVLVPHDIEHFVHLSNFAGDTEAFNRRSSGLGNRVENATPNYEAAGTKLYIAISSFAGSTRVILI